MISTFELKLTLTLSIHNISYNIYLVSLQKVQLHITFLTNTADVNKKVLSVLQSYFRDLGLNLGSR
jgi:hypothetical protein